MTDLAAALHAAVDHLHAEGARFALVGGLAVSSLRPRGYRVLATVEQDETGRLATVRLQTRGAGEPGYVVDLLFASSGLKPEVVEQAEELEVLPGVRAPVARSGHLIALKVLACDRHRPQDLVDLAGLLSSVDDEELRRACEALRFVHERGFGRGKDLQLELEDHLRSFRAGS